MSFFNCTPLKPANLPAKASSICRRKQQQTEHEIEEFIKHLKTDTQSGKHINVHYKKRNKYINSALNKMVTTSSSLVSNEDMLYFPSVKLSLVMTMVMLISTFTTTVHVNNMTLQLDTNKRRLVDVL